MSHCPRLDGISDGLLIHQCIRLLHWCRGWDPSLRKGHELQSRVIFRQIRRYEAEEGTQGSNQEHEVGQPWKALALLSFPLGFPVWEPATQAGYHPLLPPLTSHRNAWNCLLLPPPPDQCVFFWDCYCIRGILIPLIFMLRRRRGRDGREKRDKPQIWMTHWQNMYLKRTVSKICIEQWQYSNANTNNPIKNGQKI